MFNIWRQIITDQNQKTNFLLRDCLPISKEYQSTHNYISNIGFNLFTLVSDIYYRENFHSDIIKSLLDPYESHNESYKFLHTFIDLLNNSEGPTKINKSFYMNTSIIRESRNIDILILDENSKRAILIENKINNAGDMPRQIPRYYNSIKDEYIIDAIVYLTINKSKRPDTKDWTSLEKSEIKNLLKIIPAYDRDHKPNLYSFWLLKCIAICENTDNALIIKQYANLIKYLSINYMDTISLEKFYNTIKENDNLSTSISIRNMLNDLPEYLAIRVEDRYKNKCYPFEKIWRYKNRDTVFEAFKKDDIYLKLDVWCSENGYTLHFWHPHNTSFDIFKQFSDWKPLSGFSHHNNQLNNVSMNFDLFDEDYLFQIIDNLLLFLEGFKNDY